MGLRRAPRSVPSRMRLVALLVVVVTASTGALLALGEPASAARARPTVSFRVVAPDTAAVSGRTATASARVRLYRYTASRWVLVQRTRAHHHRYRTTVSVADGSSATFRVTANHRSRKLVVAMPARTTKTSSPTSYDACGARPRKADGSTWSCSFHDDFDGTSLDRTKWLPQTVFASGTDTTYACYRDDPSNVSVASGALNLTLRELDAPAPCGMSSKAPTPYQSGMVSTYHLFSQQYGRFEARVKNTATSVPGLHEAFWMWPDDRVPSTVAWPAAGEIDVSETYSAYSNLSVPFLHYSADSGGPQPGTNTAWTCTAYRGQWNTYTLEWSPGRLEIFVNGKSCLVNTSGDSAFQKPYILAFTQSIGTTGNEYDGRAPLPATMSVDYVRAWK